jgi:DNA-directed RNA polymerase subunit RPC12/RpoP
MLIKFLCPNGHPLSTSSARAGKPGQCPKCGTKFLVPDAEDEHVEPSGSDAAATAAGADSAQGTIVFLCPNGHQLNGPSQMQGKAGQCPHCGVKFLVPVYDDQGDEEAMEEVVDVEDVEVVEEVEAAATSPAVAAGSGVRGNSRSGSGLDFLAALESGSASDSSAPVGSTIGPVIGQSGDVHQTNQAATPNGDAQGGGEPHPLAGVFARFWRQRGKRGVVELHLADGTVLTPKKFSPRLSHPTFGVFAVDDSDGTSAVVTIPWSCISQLHLRGLKKLPEGVFE